MRALALLCLAACGGSASSADPVTTAEASSTCADFSAHATTCGWGGNINGVDWNCGEAAALWRADVFRAVASCAIDLPCAGSGASCSALATGNEPLAIHDQYATRCQERKTECSLTASGDVSALILLCQAERLSAYGTPVIDAILACFDQPCASVVACLDDVL